MPRGSKQYCCVYATLVATFRLPLRIDHLLPAFFYLLVSVFCLTSSYAQSATAALSGTVEDPKGAVVPGASIVLINADQGSQRLTTTNSEGSFVFPLLPPGRYSITATAVGFAPVEIKGLVLNVNDQSLLKIRLNIGNVSQTVDIVDGVPLVNESPAVSTIVDRQFIGNLPLNGRSFQSLIALTPGVVLTKTSVLAQGQFSVNGQRASTNYFTVDGVSANIGASSGTYPGQSGAGSLPGLSAFGGTNNLVSIDALQEFKIQTSTYAPEFGRTPGAQISIITRAGTNRFSGTLFEYFRNDVLDANDWFANANRQAKPAERQNDFGGVFGGPLVKNQVFFFFSYEGLRLRQPQVGTTDVPSLVSRQIASLAIQPFLNAYPRPTGPDRPNGLATFAASFSNPSTLNATSIRVDENVNSKLMLFGRYNYAPSETIGRGGPAQTLNTLTLSRSKTQTLTVGGTYVVTPRLSNDLRFNYSRNSAETLLTLDDFGGAVVPSPSVLFPSGISNERALFAMFLGGGAQRSGLFLGRNPTNIQRQLNLVDSLSLLTGDHQLKFGGDYRRLSPIFSAPEESLQLIFGGVGTPGSPATGTALSGRITLATISSQVSSQEVIFDNFSIYGQDTWKVSPRLSLTYGIRWEVNPPPHEANGRDPLVLTQISDPSTFAFAPRGTPLWKTTHNNVAPRVGAAYRLSNDPGRELVVRGGFGIFYDLGNGQAANAFTASFPFTAQKPLSNAPFPLSAIDATPPVAGVIPSMSDSIYVFDPKLKLPRVYQWNISVERSLRESQSITASYVAAVGRRLLRLVRLQNISPTIRGNININQGEATSDYHAMQLQFQRRLSRGFQAIASYAWSKSLDIGSSDSTVSTPAFRFGLLQDRGPSDFDVRHAFSGALTYNLPAPHIGYIGNKLLSDWSIDSIITAHSATPVNVTYSATIAGLGGFALRPDLLLGVPLYLEDPTLAGGRKLNPSAFVFTTTARQGTLGRNALRGLGLSQVDLAVRRQFNLTERVNLQLRTEVFNLFNHPNFGDPSGNLGSVVNGALVRSSSFGLSSTMLGRSLGTGGLTGGFNPLYQVGGPRSIQFSLKLNF